MNPNLLLTEISSGLLFVPCKNRKQNVTQEQRKTL